MHPKEFVDIVAGMIAHNPGERMRLERVGELLMNYLPLNHERIPASSRGKHHYG